MTTAERLMEQGEARGLAWVLVDLLRQKFGAVPDEAQRRIAGADLPDLQQWTRRVLAAQTLGDVFAD